MSVNTPAAENAASTPTFRDILKMLAELFKLRVVMLLVVAALGGAFLGVGGVPTLRELVLVLITGALAAGGASAINQWVEQDIDTHMKRTKDRPLASGQITKARWVPMVAVGMIVLAVVMVLPGNPIMAFYLGLGAVIYVGIYTVWLKPRSIINIVIGSAAGSCAVMTGGAAVGAASDPGVIALAALLFAWSPTHFWALALYYKDDYAKAKFPMLPVHVSERASAWWIFIHALVTGFAALMLAFHPHLGLWYLAPALIMTAIMMVSSIKLIVSPIPKNAIRLFVFSNLFLLLILLAIMLVSIGRTLLG